MDATIIACLIITSTQILVIAVLDGITTVVFIAGCVAVMEVFTSGYIRIRKPVLIELIGMWTIATTLSI